MDAIEGASPDKPFVVEESLAVLWAQAQTKNHKPNSLYLVSGFGEHVLALLPRLDPSSLLVVYEASLSRLKATVQAKDYSFALQDPRLQLFAGRVDAAEFERLQQMPLARVGEATALRFSPAWQLDDAGYQGFFAEFARQLEAARALHRANFNDGLFWQAASFRNLLTHSASPDVGVLAGRFKNIPAVLVGAGPSLDEAGDFLRSMAQKALIIAVNSSYRKLRNIGVKPHLVLAADPRWDTARGFHGQPTDDGTFLVAPFIVNPEVVLRFKGHAFSWSGQNNSLVNLLRQRLDLGEGTTLLEKGTVSLAAADLVCLIGANRLILVGQDMCLAPDGQTHVKDSIYEGAKIKTSDPSREPPMKTVQGNTFGEVKTLNNLFVYLKSFEQWVQAHPQVEIFNTARLGAKIGGVPYVTYEQAAVKINGPMQGDIPDLFTRLQQAHDRAPETSKNTAEWRNALRLSQQFAQKLYRLALRTAVALEALPERYYQSSFQDHKDIRALFEAFDAINGLIDKNPNDYKVLLDGRLKKTLLEFQQARATLEAPNAHAERMLLNREFCWALVDGIEPALALMSEIT